MMEMITRRRGDRGGKPTKTSRKFTISAHSGKLRGLRWHLIKTQLPPPRERRGGLYTMVCRKRPPNRPNESWMATNTVYKHMYINDLQLFSGKCVGRASDSRAPNVV